MNRFASASRADRRRIAAANGGWGPWQEATAVPKTEAEMRDIARVTGSSYDLVRDAVLHLADKRLVKNNVYQVQFIEFMIDPEWPGMVHLSIKRIDKAPLGTEHYADLLRIKNGLLSANHEAVEVYPAESRLADTANQYHLWCIRESGVGFPFSRIEEAPVPGTSTQRVGAYEIDVTRGEHLSASAWPAMTQLRIRRQDGRLLGPEYFRDLQRLKNTICGPEHEGCEIYPSGSAHRPGVHVLHVFEDAAMRLPFGFGERLVLEEAGGGAVQQPFRAVAS